MPKAAVKLTIVVANIHAIPPARDVEAWLKEAYQQACDAVAASGGKATLSREWQAEE